MDQQTQALAANLPERVFTRLLSTGEVIAIVRGESGYYPVQTKLTPEELNGPSVTRAQIMAMENGSMFGWTGRGADPAYCEQLLAKAAQRKAARGVLA